MWPEEEPDVDDGYVDAGWYGREVFVADNPVIGVILGPDGEVMSEVLERPVLPFGFTPWR